MRFLKFLEPAVLIVKGLAGRDLKGNPYKRTGHLMKSQTLPRPDYFDGGAKFIAHCLNFDKCFAGGKIQSQFFDLHVAKFMVKLWI